MFFTPETDGNNKLLSLNIDLRNVIPRGTHDYHYQLKCYRL